METFLLILAAILFLLAAFLFGRSRQLMTEIKQMKDDVSQLKNVGDLLSVTESTLEETNKTIETARRVMDKRIRRMEELVRAMESGGSGNHTRRGTPGEDAPGVSREDRITDPVFQPPRSSGARERMTDPDADEREYIARRNRQIILLLEEGVSEEEISRRTEASMHEIKLIRKFIQ
jgi:hypothetical protein